MPPESKREVEIRPWEIRNCDIDHSSHEQPQMGTRPRAVGEPGPPALGFARQLDRSQRAVVIAHMIVDTTLEILATSLTGITYLTHAHLHATGYQKASIRGTPGDNGDSDGLSIVDVPYLSGKGRPRHQGIPFSIPKPSVTFLLLYSIRRPTE